MLKSVQSRFWFQMARMALMALMALRVLRWCQAIFLLHFEFLYYFFALPYSTFLQTQCFRVGRLQNVRHENADIPNESGDFRKSAGK